MTDAVASALSYTPDLSRGVFFKASGGGPAEVTLLEGSKETRLTDTAPV